MLLKNKFLFILVFVLGIVLGGSHAYSQQKKGAFMYKDENGIERSRIRQILNQFSLTLMTGYGRTFYSHDLSDFSLLQKENTFYIIDNATVTETGANVGFSNWMTDPERAEGVYKGPNDVLINSDSTGLGFKVKGTSIPLILSLQYNISRFRLGVGVAAEFHKIRTFKPSFDENLLNEYEEESINTLQTRIFGTVGARVWDYWDYSFVVDAQFGKHNRGSAFNKSQMSQGMYFNLGVAIEKNLSEYFRVIVRPAYEFSGYTMNLPESDLSIKNKAPMLYVQAGISLTYPEIPRCPIKSCHTQMKHIHFGREYRASRCIRNKTRDMARITPSLICTKGAKKGKGMCSRPRSKYYFHGSSI